MLFGWRILTWPCRLSGLWPAAPVLGNGLLSYSHVTRFGVRSLDDGEVMGLKAQTSTSAGPPCPRKFIGLAVTP